MAAVAVGVAMAAVVVVVVVMVVQMPQGASIDGNLHIRYVKHMISSMPHQST